jgi:ketosteroid isomerase-like protein
MSQENVEIVRRNLDAFNRRDIDDYIATIADDFLLHSQFAGVDADAYHGHADVARYFQDLAEAWHRYRAEPMELVEGEGGRVACQLVTRAQAERSGIEVTKRIGAVFNVRAGKIVGIEAYPTHSEALEAVGLSEQDAHTDS